MDRLTLQVSSVKQTGLKCGRHKCAPRTLRGKEGARLKVSLPRKKISVGLFNVEMMCPPPQKKSNF